MVRSVDGAPEARILYALRYCMWTKDLMYCSAASTNSV